MAVVGSGPAGLAAAQQLARAGHAVTVFERAEKPGGLLRYGIPEFKMEKAVLDRRLAQMEAEGVTFVCSTAVGRTSPRALIPRPDRRSPIVPEPGEERGLGTACAPDVTVRSAADVRAEFDAVVLAGGATLPRDLPVPGRTLDGVHLALEYLKPSNLVREGALAASPITGRGKHVIIIGGGDTGADCLGTVHRQGAASVHQFEIMPEPRATGWRRIPGRCGPSSCARPPPTKRAASACSRSPPPSSSTTAWRGAGPAGSRGRDPMEEGARSSSPSPAPSSSSVPAGVAGHGLLGTERRGVVGELGMEVDGRGSVAADDDWATNVDGVFVCGDQTRGQSLIVWAIAEGRSAAAAVDRWLMGETSLPAPIVPGQLALR